MKEGFINFKSLMDKIELRNIFYDPPAKGQQKDTDRHAEDSTTECQQCSHE